MKSLKETICFRILILEDLIFRKVLQVDGIRKSIERDSPRKGNESRRFARSDENTKKIFAGD